MPRSATPLEPADHAASRTAEPDSSIPRPARPRRAALPHALTFFLTSSQRRAALAALRRRHAKREPALLGALGIPPEGTSARGRP